MSTTSSSRADRFFALPILFLAFRCATSAPAAEPEAPRAQERAVAQRPPLKNGRDVIQRPVIATANLDRATRAPKELQRGMTPAELETGVLIDVTTEQPLGPLVFNIYPAIVLNGRVLESTRVIGDQHLAALAPRGALRNTNRVAVTWLGAKSTLTSKEVVATRHSD